jgi:uncharacterized protein YbaR (Trm112 family)
MKCLCDFYLQMMFVGLLIADNLCTFLCFFLFVDYNMVYYAVHQCHLIVILALVCCPDCKCYLQCSSNRDTNSMIIVVEKNVCLLRICRVLRTTLLICDLLVKKRKHNFMHVKTWYLIALVQCLLYKQECDCSSQSVVW